jgi:NitT/TauT family transport system substrate-binding protein
MDCDTAIQRGRVEGVVTDLVRAMRIDQQGVKMRYVAATNAYWQLVTNRNARIKQLKQLDDKMVAMTRYSATDLLTDCARDSVKLAAERLYKVQINDLNVRVQMLMNNEIDALWLPEPQAIQARIMKHSLVLDSRNVSLNLGIMAFREKEMRRQARAKQLALLIKAYNQACDSINKNGIAHYKQIFIDRYQMKAALVDSLPQDIRFPHARGPRQQDVTFVEKWLERVKSEIIKSGK